MTTILLNMRLSNTAGFVDNMNVPGHFYVNEHLKSLLFDELEQYSRQVTWHTCMFLSGVLFLHTYAIMQGGGGGNIGGFLPAMKQIANVAALPGIVGRSIALPDVHAGYGFAIGNVAAFDMGTHAHTHGRTHAHIHVHAHTRTRTRAHTHTYTPLNPAHTRCENIVKFMHTRTHVHEQMNKKSICTCVCVCVDTYMHTRTHIHAHTNACTYACMSTRTHVHPFACTQAHAFVQQHNSTEICASYACHKSFVRVL